MEQKEKLTHQNNISRQNATISETKYLEESKINKELRENISTLESQVVDTTELEKYKKDDLIIFGINSAKNYSYPTKCLVITSQGTKNRDWLNYLGLEKYDIFDMVEPNPSMETVDKILTKFDFELFSTIIGLGGGSSLDVAKYVAFKTNKR